MLSPAFLVLLGAIALLVLLPTRRLFLAGFSGTVLTAYYVIVVALAVFVAELRAPAKYLLPVLVVAYIAPFVTARNGVARVRERFGGSHGRGSGTANSGQAGGARASGSSASDSSGTPGASASRASGGRGSAGGSARSTSGGRGQAGRWSRAGWAETLGSWRVREPAPAPRPVKNVTPREAPPPEPRG